MNNFLLNLSFVGTDFHGWQTQKNAITVQGILQNTLKIILGESVSIIGCSRTDAGVHAKQFVCNFHSKSSINPDKLTLALNALLPKSISVKSCGFVPTDFHSRYDCKSKQYEYIIINNKIRDPFLENRAFHYPYALNTELLNEAVKQFVGIHDFTAFCSADSSVKNKTRNIFFADVKRKDDLVIFTFEGDGFLYNMVRIMSGTLIAVNEGKIKPDDISNIINLKERRNAGITLKPYGLYLSKVNY
ncbi:MAG: tRNA pseudouridine(38-40) synthase TruA [Candidatus Fimenecus sp.]